MAEERFSFGQISLCNDTILYMAQQFLSPRESLYLALSRVSDRFNELYAINRYYKLTTMLCKSFLYVIFYTSGVNLISASAMVSLLIPGRGLSSGITLPRISLFLMPVAATGSQQVFYPIP